MYSTIRDCKFLSLFSVISFLTNALWSQDTIQDIPGYFQDQLETVLEDAGVEGDFDFNDIGETFSHFFSNPLSLNRATETDLQSLSLLSDIQIADLLQYRESLGALLSVFELQNIPSFDLNTIQRVLPYVTIDEQQIFDAPAFYKMLYRGRNELYFRTGRILEEQRGYRTENGTVPKYQGGPNQYYVRFKHQFEQNLSYGFTLEKDPGEPFFKGINSVGFDYSSYHLFARDLNSHIHSLALGDYAVSLGQGLIMHSGYGGGKSSFVTRIKKGGRILRPYTAVNEAAALRGLATTLRFDPFQLTIFASKRRQDGNIRIDSTDVTEPSETFTSLQISGLHRTLSEIEDKRAISHQVIGGSLRLQRNTIKLGINFLNNHFDQPFARRSQLYNQFYFQGTSLSNASIDYSYRFKNIHLFGEVAASDNQAIAQSHGILLGISRYIDLSLLYRNISPRYQALQANPFIESSQANNEKGIYIGSQIKFNRALWLSIYADYWSHPWLRFGTDAPSTGSEHLFRLTYYKKRKLEAYMQWRSETKGFNTRSETDALNRVASRRKDNLRIHISNKVDKSLELRNRIELTRSLVPLQKSLGFLVYQDIIFKSIKSPFSFSTRLCYFDTDDYNSRIYAYENDILYSYSIPALFNEGFRYYFNLRYRLDPLTLEARFEQTHFKDVDTISSGNELIDGNVRTRIKIQARFIF